MAFDHNGLPTASYRHDSCGRTSVSHSQDTPVPPDSSHFGTGKVQWRTRPSPSASPGWRISMVTSPWLRVPERWLQKMAQTSSGVPSTTME